MNISIYIYIYICQGHGEDGLWEAYGINVCGGVGTVTLGLGGFWIPPEGIPPALFPFPLTRAPLPVRVYPNGQGKGYGQ